VQTLVHYLQPWEFSPTVLLACILPAFAYARGLREARREGQGPAAWQPIAFFLGVALMYGVQQTYFDYLSQHMFWVHRLQHLVLHHIAPVLLVVSEPLAIMRRGVPPAWRTGLVDPLWRNRVVQGLYAFLQHPVVAPVLFVGLIYFWLVPSVHFGAMLSAERYHAMNWSMALDGLLFWWLMLAPLRAQEHARLGYFLRILVLFLVMVPQIILGSYITLHRGPLYDVYEVCGRAWAIDPLEDQQFGGLLTWIPAAMMSVLGILLVVRLMLDERTAGPVATPGKEK